MHIQRNSSQLGGLLPEAVIILYSLDSSVPLYHLAHREKSRHPIGVYNISWQSVLLNFDLVLREIDAVINAIDLNGLSQYRGSGMLGHCQGNLLRSIDEHLEDCGKILRAFFAPGENFNGNPHIKAFNVAIKPYKDHVRDIVNCLKHEQGRIRTAVLVNPEAPSFPGRTIFTPTYSVEGIDNEGIPGPHPELHAEPDAAFSYFYDLKYHFCNFYIVSQYLAVAVTKVVGEQNITSPENINANDTLFTQIAQAIASLPERFLKPEKAGDMPSVKYGYAEESVQLSLDFPTIEPLPVFDFGTRTFVVTDWPGDGVSRSQRLPFAPSHPFPPEEPQTTDKS